MTDPAKARRALLKDAARVAEIVTILTKYGFASWVVGVPEQYEPLLGRLSSPELLEMSDGERLRMALLDLGVTFIKIGQILSTRSDLIGKDGAAALSTLQGEVPPDAPGTARATIEEELGRPIEDLFAAFDDEPLGSASIAQVHAATLNDGTEVVLKVQHPGIKETINRDLEILEALAVLAEEHDPDIALYRPAGIAAQLRRSLLAETDFMLEARNLIRVRKNFAEEPDIVIPQPYLDLCTERVLTMSRMDGVPLSAVIDDLGPSGEAIMRRGADMYVEMVFRDGFFHADPHPGNIFILDDDRIGLLDFGKVGRIDEDLQDEIDGIVVAVLTRDIDGVTDGIVKMCDPPSTLDRAALRSDISDWLDRYGSAGVASIDMRGLADATDEILRRHRLFVPPDVALMLRTLVQLQGLLSLTGYDISVVEVLQPHMAMIAAKRFAPKRMLRHAKRTAKDWEYLIDTLPRDVAAILEGVKAGRIEVPLNVEGLDRNVNRLVYAALAAALFTGSARLWASRVPPRIGDMSLPGAVGTISAGLFAIRLLRSARRSGGIG
ncbi:MAG: AarF/ABC1/UbiB kinase family protein [Acidimicrobiia bacterium]|nr:MAG: AarF/ABC1/UbiB kinase family protein [Acidimicrobiia bacterium]